MTHHHSLSPDAALSGAFVPLTNDTPVAGDHLEMLRRVTRHMVVNHDLPAVLDSIVTAVVEHTGGVLSRIALYYDSVDQCDTCRTHPNVGVTGITGPVAGPALHFLATAGAETDITGAWHLLPLSLPTFLCDVARNRRAELVNDISNEPRLQNIEPIRQVFVRLNVRAAACYPLIFRGELLGVIGMLNTRPFAQEEFELLGIFADQAAMAIKSAHLLREIERHRVHLAMQNAYLQEEIKEERGFAGIIGASPTLKAVLRKVNQVAPVETTVLLTGETGTGKELIARAIHEGSARKGRPLIKVNCGAIPQGVVESELFGHEKGAFTGALQRRIGRFELADKGTLFMDELGELPLDTQVKLLRVLQEQEFERVGSTRPISVDVRLVAATNRDLEQEVAAGRFRSDLFYRLNVFPIHIPPLRDRKGDIPLLVQHMLAQLQRKLAKPLKGVTVESMERLQAYAWPGNVRELQNVLERACVLATGPIVDVDGPLAPDERAPVAARASTSSTSAASEPLVSLDDNERAHIRRALAACGGRINGAKGAATLLGINPSTLRSRMQKLGVGKD